MVFQKKYEWSGFAYNVPAQVVGEHVEALEKRDGDVTRESFLESARDEGSVVHNLFEWNDSIAGERWRLHQAGKILTNLKVNIVYEEKEPVKVKAFLNAVPGSSKGRFFNVQAALSRVDTRAGVLQRAKEELQAFTDKYRTLSELSSVIKVIDDFLNKEA